jgi:hypothetical protein
MKCEYFNEMIPEYISGELDKNNTAELEKHTLTCEKCRNEIITEKYLLNNISAEDYDLPADLNRTVIENLPKTHFIFNRPYFAYTAAASVILMIIASAVLNFSKPVVKETALSVNSDSVTTSQINTDYSTYAYIDEDFEDMVAYDASLYESDKWTSDNSEVFSSDDELVNDLITLEELETYGSYLSSL